MNNCNCYGAFALGILIPLLACLLFYLLLAIYVFYYTDRYRSIDLKKWKTDQFDLVNMKYNDGISQINDQISQISSL